MKNIARGLFVGLGSAVKIGLGFEPIKVKVVKVGHANLTTLEWFADMARTATGAGGIVRAGVANVPAFALLAITAGIRRYDGGDVVSASSLAYQIPVQDNPDTAGNRAGDIARWTLRHTTNRTGNFNAGLDTTLCGVGSMVEIGGRKYRIVALTNDGDAANEVTLDRAAPSGKVSFVGTKVDWVAAPVGARMPAGFEILDVTHVNEAATTYAFEAEGE